LAEKYLKDDEKKPPPCARQDGDRFGGYPIAAQAEIHLVQA